MVNLVIKDLLVLLAQGVHLAKMVRLEPKVLLVLRVPLVQEANRALVAVPDSRVSQVLLVQLESLVNQVIRVSEVNLVIKA